MANNGVARLADSLAQLSMFQTSGVLETLSIRFSLFHHLAILLKCVAYEQHQ